MRRIKQPYQKYVRFEPQFVGLGVALRKVREASHRARGAYFKV